MKSFFKIFFACMLAIVVLTVIGVIVLFAVAAGITSKSKETLDAKSVLVLDLSTIITEQTKNASIPSILNGEKTDLPGLFDVVRMLEYAKTDVSVKGLYIKANGNPNGFSTSEELRNAILSFKKSNKFVIAYGDAISQKAYYVGSAADKIYCNPQGGVDWMGLGTSMLYMKDLLAKLEVEPMIFYAGKFKSATEPLRESHMTDANREQLTILFGGLVNEMNNAVGASRKIEPAVLKHLQDSALVQTANDALTYKLVDGLRYDDEIKAEIAKNVGITDADKIKFVSMGKYRDAADYKKTEADDHVAVIYAQGDIVGGKGSDENIGADNFRNLLMKARVDKNIKAIVLRVNSPGGSALASEIIWREVALAKKAKPVVVSMGDYAASGGYYISCNADSIFADANTLTGSIGVFSMMFNVEKFFKNKLGINFDGVRTSPYADAGSGVRQMTPREKKMFQNGVDTIYHYFKTRVSQGRKIDMEIVDSIAQGRVWTGTDGINLRLADRKGGIKEAVECAARMAKLKTFVVEEFPEKKSNAILGLLSAGEDKDYETKMIKEHVGENAFKILQQYKKVESMVNVPQTRMEYDLIGGK